MADSLMTREGRMSANKTTWIAREQGDQINLLPLSIAETTGLRMMAHDPGSRNNKADHMKNLA